MEIARIWQQFLLGDKYLILGTEGVLTGQVPTILLLTVLPTVVATVSLL